MADATDGMSLSQALVTVCCCVTTSAIAADERAARLLMLSTDGDLSTDVQHHEDRKEDRKLDCANALPVAYEATAQCPPVF